jgi:hypothetical protein
MSDNWDVSAFAQRQFVEKLEACERNLYRLDDPSSQFIKDMRERFNSREDADDLGLKRWSPSVRQLNYLNNIYQSFP